MRVDRLTVPWYVGLILDVMGASVPEPSYLSRGGYVFFSLDAGNLAAVVKAADTGDNLAGGKGYAGLTQGLPADLSLLLWYDSERSEPFLLRGSSVLLDVVRLYAQGVIAVRATATDVHVTLAAARAIGGGAKLLPGFPLAPKDGVTGDVLAFRFADAKSPTLAWLRGRSVVVLADAGGTQIAEAPLEADSVLVPEWREPAFSPRSGPCPPAAPCGVSARNSRPWRRFPWRRESRASCRPRSCRDGWRSIPASTRPWC